MWHRLCRYICDKSDTMMTLTEKIQTAFIGAKYPGVNDLEDELTKLTGRRMTWYDTVIDDGVDEDETEDQYVMRACFSSDSDDLIVRVYYGDVTEEIGYVDVMEVAI